MSRPPPSPDLHAHSPTYTFTKHWSSFSKSSYLDSDHLVFASLLAIPRRDSQIFLVTMAESKTVYAITGVNRGIGLCMVQKLLARPQTVVIGTVRNEDARAQLLAADAIPAR
ncbi:hypothetical protein NLG97_g9652 [Lecanicillium saksenae]|uniref:Uncharacterized protein n=1 Tax=Lecanicillium saksenae TaxID=468837 RepID=A0ACC1QJD2_9HYPO|nr:hypothetical protein NLG97_g9652 [Lecanicillium saksenae]